MALSTGHRRLRFRSHSWDVHALLAGLAAEHVHAILAELGEPRTRRAALGLTDALTP